jgi:probable F420-dependent oxidoreductase
VRAYDDQVTSSTWSVSVSSPRRRTTTEWTETARQYETWGYDALLLADHTYSVDPLLPLVTIAHATNRLRVGTLVLNMGFWHPLLLARAAATLQLLSDGRVDLGIGAGWAKKEHDGLGIAFDSPRDRVDKLIEAGAMLRQALHGETITPTAHFPVTDTKLVPEIDVAPRLIVGGHGPRLLRGCAAWADIIQLTGATDDRAGGLYLHDASLADFERRVEWIRDGASDRFDDITLSVLIQKIVVTASAAETATVVAETAAEFECSEDVVRDTPVALVGTPDEIVSKLTMLRERLGVSHASVFAPNAEAFSAILPMLA